MKCNYDCNIIHNVKIFNIQCSHVILYFLCMESLIHCHCYKIEHCDINVIQCSYISFQQNMNNTLFLFDILYISCTSCSGHCLKQAAIILTKDEDFHGIQARHVQWIILHYHESDHIEHHYFIVSIGA